ncbi:glycosyltransferase family 4 protein [Holdemania massiliensis]|uniref:glycosyltransferase family 4 protein n=1 Tax=Holdemania massiliensis TaxID=1468449 RepID=UPI001F070B46|nr:glycosyltransferase family 4 protein [Holdemania massiliensis]MCH1940967.1 glycosyltransferase family 4 protein [Holdemania massiliensis]
MIKIAIIGTKEYPIPNIRGGAIETLVTALIDENEKFHKMDIDLITIKCTGLDKVTETYRRTNFVLLNEQLFSLHIKEFLYRICRRLSGYRLSYRDRHMMAANEYLKKHTYDVVVFENTALDMMQACTYGTAKNFFHIHADYINKELKGIESFCKHCDLLVGVSDFISKRLETLPYMDGKTRTLKNAIDTTMYGKERYVDFRIEMRKKYGFHDCEKVILYCSRLSREKGILELVKAVQKVPECKLLIVGGENFSSDKMTEYTQELQIEIQKIKNRVVMTGYIPHDDVPKYMSIADIGAIPSVCNEAASLTLLEMRSSGLPTIASRRGGIPEYCSEETTILVDTDDNFIDHLAEGIRILCTNNELYAKMQMVASQEMEQFDYSNYYWRFVNMIKREIKYAD